MIILQFDTYSDTHIYLQIHTSGAVRGKFVSGVKVLAAMPSVSQRRRIYREPNENKDRLEIGGEAVVNKD